MADVHLSSSTKLFRFQKKGVRKKGGAAMSLVGKQAPDFDLEGYFNGSMARYKLSDYTGK